LLLLLLPTALRLQQELDLFRLSQGTHWFDDGSLSLKVIRFSLYKMQVLHADVRAQNSCGRGKSSFKSHVDDVDERVIFRRYAKLGAKYIYRHELRILIALRKKSCRSEKFSI